MQQPAIRPPEGTPVMVLEIYSDGVKLHLCHALDNEGTLALDDTLECETLEDTTAAIEMGAALAKLTKACEGDEKPCTPS